MNIMALRPWTDMVTLHPDVEAGALTEAIFAIDLGAIAARDPNVPAVNRTPEAFFRATHITADLGRLLEEVLASLAGEPGYNRVLKLRTPFGGVKSHTLAALLHAARDRAALNVVTGAERFADPGQVRVAVFDGEKFGALEPTPLPNGQAVQTMWGWLAWQIGGEKARALVAENDRNRTAPGGDLIHRLLTEGADGRPVLLLLDEVLKYMERAASVAVLDSTLARQAKDFFQNLTVEVAKTTHAVMVYSLQWSAREALGNMALLDELDKLASRVDQLREPVSGDEVLPILQRRLLGGKPDEATASDVGAAYEEVVTTMRRAYADNTTERQMAEEEGILLRERFKAAYPFHPALIDAMRERWTAVDAFQRTRGSLRFLGQCLHSLKKNGGARPLLGPGDIPLRDPEVRLAMLKELNAQNDYDPVVAADIEGPNARARRIDDRLARETPALASVRPATRLATAIFVYSFGGLKRQGETDAEALPPGVTEAELLAACVGPDLDSITATAVLADLRTSCLYLHYDGLRYCFKKDPNVTKLVKDAEQEVARNAEEVRGKIKELLTQRLAGQRTVVVWPAKTQDVPDREPAFLLGYLPLEFAAASSAEQERQAIEMFTRYGDRPRSYRNGIGLAIPDRKQVEALRRAVRYLMACDRVEARKSQLRLSKDLLDQLKERKRTEEAAVEAAFRALYTAVWLPRVEEGGIGIERVEAAGRPLQATGIHERMLELLTVVGTPKMHPSVTPRKIIERLRLRETAEGEEAARPGVRVSDVRDAFFAVLEPPRLDSLNALRKAIVRGVQEGAFGYASGYAPNLGTDGRYQLPRERIAFCRALSEDEVDFDSGFLMLPAAIPEAVPVAPTPEPFPAGVSEGLAPTSGGVSAPPTPSGPASPPSTATTGVVKFGFVATRDQVFRAFPAIANLAEKADGGKVAIQVEASAAAGFDPAWLRNAVEEPLDEADIERLETN